MLVILALKLNKKYGEEINTGVYTVKGQYHFNVLTLTILKEVNGGLGIPQNIVTACINCHYEYDMGKNTKYYVQFTEDYLKSQYEDWDKQSLIYNKWR